MVGLIFRLLSDHRSLPPDGTKHNSIKFFFVFIHIDDNESLSVIGNC